MKVNIFIFLAILIFLLPSAVPDITSDRAALVSLRNAVKGRIQFWDLSSASPCSWAGVVCSTDNSSVLELHLPGMGLGGQLPANTLSNLTNLNTLSLRFNSLTGPLPSDLFTSLLSLRNLYLQHNAFSGEIPQSFFALSSLVRVNLGENRLSGPISPNFNNLTQLGTLYLQGNQFSGSIPDLNLPALQQFDVSNNKLVGQIPASLSRNSRTSFSGNSLCGNPLDSCDGSGRARRHKGLSGGAIAGIVIGVLVGILLILLLVFCLCKVCLGKKRGKKPDTENDVRSVPKEVEIPAQNGASSGFVGSAGAKDKEKGVETSNVMNVGGKKGLIFFGNTGWKFDLDDLLRASAEVLGKGTFGTAYKAALENGAAVAVKRLRDVNLPEKEFRGKMEEIGSMDNEYIVPLRAYYYNKDEMLLVYDYLSMGSLSALLHGNKGAGRTPLNWDTRATIALGAARGISYLHSQGSSISHGSVKSSNILLTKSYEARVSDFGLAQLSGPTATPNRVAGYRAPEVTDHRKVSQKADVYSFGVLLLELLTGKAPTHALLNEEGVDLPRWVQSVVREEWTAEVFDLELLRYQNVEEDMVRLLQLAVDCTEQYPDKRPTMAHVVTQIEELCRSNVDIVSEEPSPLN